jgi:hypothetical protein
VDDEESEHGEERDARTVARPNGHGRASQPSITSNARPLREETGDGLNTKDGHIGTPTMSGGIGGDRVV